MNTTINYESFDQKATGAGNLFSESLNKHLNEQVIPELEAKLKDYTDTVAITVRKEPHGINVTMKCLAFGKEVIVSQTAEDFYKVAIDTAHMLIKQVYKIKEKYFDKKKDQRQKDAQFIKTAHAVPVSLEDEDEEDSEFVIKKQKKFAIKPMYVEEAILQMNLLGHNFFVFLDAETEEVTVVYKRKNGTYGLIEPTM